MGPRAGLDRCGKSRPPTGIRSQDRPARSQSLYRLRYPAHSQLVELDNNGSAEGSISETNDERVLRLLQNADGRSATTDLYCSALNAKLQFTDKN